MAYSPLELEVGARVLQPFVLVGVRGRVTVVITGIIPVTPTNANLALPTPLLPQTEE